MVWEDVTLPCTDWSAARPNCSPSSNPPSRARGSRASPGSSPRSCPWPWPPRDAAGALGSLGVRPLVSRRHRELSAPPRPSSRPPAHFEEKPRFNIPPSSNASVRAGRSWCNQPASAMQRRGSARTRRVGLDVYFRKLIPRQGWLTRRLLRAIAPSFRCDFAY